MLNNNFKPYIPAEKTLPELTLLAIILGAILAIVFGAANAYLGLRVGTTVSSSIPAAVISMAVLRVILRRNSILENNMVQTIGSAGESIAAGCIFTLPALFMWSKEWGTEAPSIIEIATIAFIGGILGILFMIPLRNALIVKEHGILPYPEGTACAEIQLAGEKGGSAKKIFYGLGLSMLFKFFSSGLKIFNEEFHFPLPFYKGAAIGADITPAMIGVGYIIGSRISTILLTGGLLTWLCFMPCICLFGNNNVLFPSTVPICDMDVWDIWSSYIRYIGAGALMTSAIINMLKALPMVFGVLKKIFSSFSKNDNTTAIRTERDIDFKYLSLGIIILFSALIFLPNIPVDFIGALLILIFGFLFAAVSSRIVGLVGSTNVPTSGLTIAVLLIATLMFAMMGNVGHSGMIEVLTIAGVICCICCIANDCSQDLKTGYIIGATPAKQQIGEMIGVIVSASTIGSVLYLLDAAWGFGSTELAAPQAMMMKMVVEGIMDANMPWNMVFIGAVIAIIIELLDIPSLPFAIGMYLPIHSTLPMFFGGVIRRIIDNKKYASDTEKQESTNNGVLFASGLIAGEGLIGILLAVLIVISIDIDISNTINLGDIGSMIALIILVASIFYSCLNKKKKSA